MQHHPNGLFSNHRLATFAFDPGELKVVFDSADEMYRCIRNCDAAAGDIDVGSRMRQFALDAE